MRGLRLTLLLSGQLWQIIIASAALAFIGSCIGCRTAPLPPLNLSEPGWQLGQGQALWRSRKDAPEIAGEIILATNTTGRAFIQFLKNPLPLVTAQISPEWWQIELIPEKRRIGGRGIPPRQLLWLQLLRALQQTRLPAGMEFGNTPEGGVRIQDKQTGESITLFLNEAQ